MICAHCEGEFAQAAEANMTSTFISTSLEPFICNYKPSDRFAIGSCVNKQYTPNKCVDMLLLM